MIKKFKTFESHLRGSKGEEREEFKISHSVKNLEKLNKLTEWYDDDKISFMDLTKTNVSIKHIVNARLNPEDYVILIKPTTFNLHKVSEVDMRYYRLFKINGVPSNFPSKYAIISEQDFTKNIGYSTLNINKLQRGDNIQEMVFITLLCVILDVPMHNGISIEEYNEDWEDQIKYYEERFPHHIEKMEKQIDKLLSELGYNWDLVYKDNSKFFVNKMASKLFYDNDEYRKKGYIFNLDKWNPADFWLIKGDINEYEKVFQYGMRSLEELNSWLNESIKSNNGIIGISHKLNQQKGKVWLNKVNVDGVREPFTHKYKGYTIKPTAMNVDIEYEWEHTINHKKGNGLITIRNYSGGNNKKVSMEIRSNKGHMSGKLTGYLRPLFGDTDFFELQKEIIYSSSEYSLIQTINIFNLEPEIYEDFLDVLNDDTIPWDYKKMSKLQGLLIVDKILKHPKGADWVIHEMVNYGRSQTTISAPYYVIK